MERDSQSEIFYEIESTSNNWSVRELRRQFDSSLYERLALSKDEHGVKQLSSKGQVLEKPFDTLKSPFVLEFLNLKEDSSYSESDLESAIMDKLTRRCIVFFYFSSTATEEERSNN